MPSILHFFFDFVFSTLLSALVNYLFIRFSLNVSVTDKSAEERWRKQAIVPTIGGISFFIVFVMSLSVLSTLVIYETSLFLTRLIGILIACSLGFLLGLLDDAYNLSPINKLFIQIICAITLYVTGTQIIVSTINWVNVVVTIIWTIGLMNSINMIDNMDSIAGIVSVVSLVTLFFFSFVTGSRSNFVLLLLIVHILGAVIGFLYYNRFPARIYMGDTGSQFLGVFLASFSIIYLWGANLGIEHKLLNVDRFVLPVLVFIIPIVDTATVFIRRIARGVSPFIGGKDHITHHLVYAGLSEKSTAIVVLSTSACFSIIAYMMFYFRGILASNYFVVFIGILMFVFFLFQYVYYRSAIHTK